LPTTSFGGLPMRDTEYRPVVGFPGYRVGNDGSVWSKRRRWRSGKWRRLRPSDNSKYDHKQVVLQRNGKSHTRPVHRLVLEAFIGPCPKGMEACHKDGVASNNYVCNLRWGTRQSNADDSKKHGTTPRGERNGMAKLTDRKVKAIKRRRRLGEPQIKLAADYKVDRKAIYDIEYGNTWTHVQEVSNS
jgi:hypothetical protein